MVRHRTHSIEFKRQVVQDYLAGETLHGLAKRHDLSRNLVRIWVQKFEAGAFDDEAVAADAIEAYEAKVNATHVALDVTGRVFELTGARSTASHYRFDRYWRNVRTHTLHDPVFYKAREVGDFVLNGRVPEPSLYS